MDTTKIFQLLPIELNNDSIKKTILTNTIKMLTSRNFINKENEEDAIDKIIKYDSDDNVYKIKLDTQYADTNDFYIKIIPQKISTLNKSSSGNLLNFLDKYKKFPKIIIAKDVNDKIIRIIEDTYIYTEIFLESHLMINLIDMEFIPKHQVLTSELAEEMLRLYNTNKSALPKIFTTDKVARYYNMKHGQICKIIRPSETAIEVPFYRAVIKK